MGEESGLLMRGRMAAMQVTVIGDGAMATVCGQILAGKGDVAVKVWGRNAERLAEIAAARENRRYLPGVRLSERLGFEADDPVALAGAGLVLCAIPTQFIRGMLTRLAPHVPAGARVVSVSKGIEVETLSRPTEIITSVLGRRAVAALSGPNIAAEMARGLPATMVAAATPADQGLAEQLQELFTTPALRVGSPGCPTLPTFHWRPISSATWLTSCPCRSGSVTIAISPGECVRTAWASAVSASTVWAGSTCAKSLTSPTGAGICSPPACHSPANPAMNERRNTEARRLGKWARGPFRF